MVGNKAHTSDSQDDAQLLEKRDGLEIWSENTQHMTIPHR
jgi:hypothetical protein